MWLGRLGGDGNIGAFGRSFERDREANTSGSTGDE
jgi:hypothetical protein